MTGLSVPKMIQLTKWIDKLDIHQMKIPLVHRQILGMLVNYNKPFISQKGELFMNLNLSGTMVNSDHAQDDYETKRCNISSDNEIRRSFGRENGRTRPLSVDEGYYDTDNNRDVNHQQYHKPSSSFNGG